MNLNVTRERETGGPQAGQEVFLCFFLIMSSIHFILRPLEFTKASEGTASAL